MPTAYLCTNDTYCPTTETFATVEDFLAVCSDCFGTAPVLRECPDGRVVDERGVTVLRALGVAQTYATAF